MKDTAIRIRLMVTVFLTVMLVSCEKSFLAESSSKLVVEGWIEDGHSPVVIVTRSVPVKEEVVSDADLSEYVVRTAKVSISDGEKTAVLTGRYDRNYFATFVYTTTRIMGEAGKTYTLTVEAGSDVATAEVSIPTPSQIDKLSCARSEAEPDKYYIKASFQDDADQRNFYHLFYRVKGKDKNYYSAFMGGFDDSDNPGGTMEVRVLRSATISNNAEKGLYFSSGDVVDVKLCTLTEPLYDFWTDYNSVVSLSRNPLFPLSIEPRTNMKGAYGYWAGYGSTTMTIELP